MQCNKESINFKGASSDIGQREKWAAILIVEALIDLNHHGNHQQGYVWECYHMGHQEQRTKGPQKISEYLIWNIFSIQCGLENTRSDFCIIKMHYWSRCSTLSWTSVQCLSKCTMLYLNHWSHPYFHPVELIVFLVGPVPPHAPPLTTPLTTTRWSSYIQ